MIFHSTLALPFGSVLPRGCRPITRKQQRAKRLQREGNKKWSEIVLPTTSKYPGKVYNRTELYRTVHQQPIGEEEKGVNGSPINEPCCLKPSLFQPIFPEWRTTEWAPSSPRSCYNVTIEPNSSFISTEDSDRGRGKLSIVHCHREMVKIG